MAGVRRPGKALVEVRSHVEEAASRHGSRVTVSIGSVFFAAGGKNALRCVSPKAKASS